MFNFNVDTVDLGAYHKGLGQAQDRKMKQDAFDLKKQQAAQAQAQQQQIQSLTQAYLGGDKTALNKIASIDPATAKSVQDIQQGRQTKLPSPKEMIDIGRSLKMIATTNPQNINPALQKVVEAYPDMAPAVQEFGNAFAQNPQSGMAMLDGFINAGTETEQPKTGRYVRERMGDELAIIDSATGQVVRKYPIPQSKKEQAELAKKTADIKKAENEAQLKVLAAESEEEKRQASTDMAMEASVIARELANDEALSQATGTISTWLPTVRESTQDVINKARRLESLLTVDNLKLMSGVLTDKDIAFLSRVAAGLNITDDGIKGSEEATRKRLIEIADKIDGSIKLSQKASQGGGETSTASSGEVNWADL